MSAIVITILIIWFLFWFISRLNSSGKPSSMRNIIANNYLLLVDDAAARKELLNEIEDTIEDHIKIDGRSRLEAERYTLSDLMKIGAIGYTSSDRERSLEYDQLLLCIAECFPQHLNTLVAYHKQLFRR